MKASLLMPAAVCCLIAVLTACNGNNNGQTGDGGSSNAATTTVTGAGSTFIYPLYSKMFAQYSQAHTVKINYQSIGSGGGILQLTNKTVDFGDSDVPLNEDQTRKMGAPVLHIPIASGAAVVTYNLPGVNSRLRMTPKLIADIYLGKVRKWNDPEISAANPGVRLQDLPVMVVHRTDGSGTTFVWTDYLTKISPEWAQRIGRAAAVNWPAGMGGKGSEGVAGLVKQTPGSIGYVELAYAVQNKMPAALVQNSSGRFVEPSLASISAASQVPLPADAKVSLTNTAAADGYPISSFTWALIYKEQNYGGRSEKQATQLLNLFWWVTHEGQSDCEPLNYAPLSKPALAVVEKILGSATYNGKAIVQKPVQK